MTNAITVYKDSDFKGKQQSFPIGVQSVLDGTAIGNDSISSIKVPEGLQVMLYQDVGWKGSNLNLRPGNYPNLKTLGWNDKVSSLVIYEDNKVFVPPNPGLPENAPSDAKQWAIIFDFDGDSCYPAPAVFADGQPNPGLALGGKITGSCRNVEQLSYANTYCRMSSQVVGRDRFSVYMYALYFEKDQSTEAGAISAGHRHDWEYALVWIKNGKLTHASRSAHGDLKTEPVEKLSFDPGMENHVKISYHKSGVSTHSFRFAHSNEKPQNARNQWFTPTLVTWDMMKSDYVTNKELKEKFNQHSFGEANCSFNDRNFLDRIRKNPPNDYPKDNWG